MVVVSTQYRYDNFTVRCIGLAVLVLAFGFMRILLSLCYIVFYVCYLNVIIIIL